MAVEANGSGGIDARDEMNEPQAHESSARRRSAIPNGSVPPPVQAGTTRKATPTNPTTTPMRVPVEMRSPKIRRKTTSQSGVEAMISAVKADGTVCSAMTTRPLPPRRSAAPTRIAAISCRRVRWNRDGPDRTSTTSATIDPAIRKRLPAVTSGGRSATTTRMAR